MIWINRHLLERFLNIRKGEEKKVFFFLLFFTLLMAGQEIAVGVSLSLFLTRVGIEKLPEMLMITSLLNTAAVIGYMVLSSKLNNRSLFSRILWGTLGVVLLVRLLEPSLPYLGSFVMYAASELFVSVIALHFSVYIADYFTIRQAKRLIPIIFVGSRIGGITGGIILNVAAARIGSVNLLILWGAAVIGALFLLRMIDQRFAPAYFDYEKTSKESARFFEHMKNSVKLFKGSKLLKALTAGIFLIGFLSIFSKFLYSGIFAELFPDTDRLTAFIGLYIILSNILGLFVQLAISNKLIDHFGLGTANLTYSTLFASSFAALFFFPSLISAVWARFADEQLESALQDPVESLLYNAIPDNERARARALSGGLFKPISEVSASLVLQAGRSVLSRPDLAFAGLMISLIYILTTNEQNRGYVEGLMKMVKEKTFSLEDLENKRWEKASKKDLLKLYKMSGSDDASVRDSSTTLLLHLDEEIDFELLRTHFFSWSAEIQQDFLANYFRRSARINSQFLMDTLKMASVPVKTFVIEYMIETKNLNAAELIHPYLKSTDCLDLQNSAIRFFYLTMENEENRSKAVEILHSRLAIEEESVIFANLSIIRDLYEEEYLPYIQRMISHPNRKINWSALDTMAMVYQPRSKEEPEIMNLVEDLIRRGNYHDIKAAVAILSKRKGTSERDMLLKMLNTSSAPIRNLILENLAREYGNHLDVYYDLLDSPTTTLELKENLVRLIERIGIIPDQERLKNTLRKLTEEYFAVIREQDWLRQHDLSHTLIAEVNERKKQQIRIVILQILGILLHQKVILSIEKALLTRNPKLISNAMELFENIWDKKHAKGLIILLHPESNEEELAISRKFTGNTELTLSSIFEKYLQVYLPRWEICSSLMLIKDIRDCQHNCNLSVFLDHQDPTVRELAEYIMKAQHSGGTEGLMLTSIEKIMYLKNAQIFKSLRMDELKLVADIAREQVCTPDEKIIEKGELGNTMFIIASGDVEIYLPGEQNEADKRLTVLGESSFFGEMALFGDDVRSASARALKATKLLCIEREHFINLIYEKPDISIEIIKVLSDRLRRMDKLMELAEKKRG